MLKSKDFFKLVLVVLVLFLATQVLATTYPNIRLTNNTGNSITPRIACDANYCYIVWEDNRDGNSEIYWCKIDHSGAKVAGDIRITNTPGTSSVSPAISTDGSGNSYIVWQEGTPWGTIYGVIMDAAGNITLGPIVLSPNLCLDPDNGVIANGTSWIVFHRRTASDQDVYVRRFDNQLNLLCERRINKGTLPEFSKHPAVAIDANSDARVLWRDMDMWWTDGIYYRLVTTTCGLGESGYLGDYDYPAIGWSGTEMWKTAWASNNNYCLYGAGSAYRINDFSGTAPRYVRVGDDFFYGYAVWHDTRDGGNSEIYLSQFNQNTPFTDIRLTDNTASSENPDIATINSQPGKWFVVWQDYRDGNNEIYFSYNVPIGTVTFAVKSAGNPVEGAKVTHIPTGQTATTGSDGKVTFDNVDVGDEIYASEAIGWGKTDKQSHPLKPGTNDCWFYEYCRDNKYIDEQKNLRKWYYTGNTEIAINHLITKLHLVLSFERELGVDEKIDGKSVKNYFEEQFRLANSYLFNATNGQVIIDAVDLFCNKDKFLDSDIRIHITEDRPNVGSWDLRFPMYVGKYDSRDENKVGMNFDGRFYKNGVYARHYTFYPAFVHELSHYFLNLGDEYTNGLSFCTGLFNYHDYHACIMSLCSINPTVANEFCKEDGHNHNGSLLQNKYHNFKSCWEYLSEDWNNSFNHDDFGGVDYTLGTHVFWETPSDIEPYQAGPYTDDLVIVNDFTVRTNVYNELFRMLENTGRHIIGVVLGIIERQTPVLEKQNPFPEDSLFYLGYFSTGSKFDDILVEGLSQNDGILIIASGYKPTIVNLSNGDSLKLVTLENITQSDLYLKRLEATISSDKTNMNFKLNAHTDSSTALTATVFQQGTSGPASVLMQYVGNDLFIADVPLDSSYGLSGLVYFSIPSGLIDCEYWQGREIVADSESFLFFNNVYLYIPPGSVSGNGIVTVVTSPSPADQIEKGLIPFCQPLTISLSENISLVSGFDMVLYYDQFSMDTLGNTSRWSEENQLWELVPSYIDSLARTAASTVESLGTFSIFSAPQPETRLILNSPSGGEALSAKCTTTVSWTKVIGSSSDSLRLYLSYDGGRTYPLLIYRNINNDSTSQFNWLVDDTLCNKAKILVMYYLPNDQVVYDESDLTFTIYKLGDTNCDTLVSVSDVVYLINYLFKGGPTPCPTIKAGNINDDGKVSVSDVVYLINYLFKGGPPPICP